MSFNDNFMIELTLRQLMAKHRISRSDAVLLYLKQLKEAPLL
tara:strand:- start:1439 stop:1564 length:126 start_codon:yes stop_codon:yes gene_type:complete